MRAKEEVSKVDEKPLGLVGSLLMVVATLIWTSLLALLTIGFLPFLGIPCALFLLGGLAYCVTFAEGGNPKLALVLGLIIVTVLGTGLVVGWDVAKYSEENVPYQLPLGLGTTCYGEKCPGCERRVK